MIVEIVERYEDGEKYAVLETSGGPQPRAYLVISLDDYVPGQESYNYNWEDTLQLDSCDVDGPYIYIYKDL